MHRAINAATVIFLSSALPLGFAGCAPKNAAVAEPEPFIRSYQAGTYQQAYDQAQAAFERTSGIEKDRAALMAGLSAYALRRPEQAEKWLIPLLTNSDAEVCGTAHWTLGLISADRGNSSRAAVLGTTAAEKLKGNDAARARVLVAESYAKLGRAAESKEQLSLALASAQDSGLRSTIEARLGGTAADPGTGVGANPNQTKSQQNLPSAPVGQFVIQLGAFADATKAERSAASARGAASKARLPSPLVVSTSDPKTGRTLYAAQIGPFGSRPEAESALRRLARPGTVMKAHD